MINLEDTKLHIQRLEILRDHLISENRYHEIFDMKTLSSIFNCKTAGCALGECPAAFPDEWEFGGHPDEPVPVLIDMSDVSCQFGMKSFRCSEYFFGLDGTTNWEIFTGNEYDNEMGKEVTPEMVAHKIDEIITTKKRGLESLEKY